MYVNCSAAQPAPRHTPSPVSRTVIVGVAGAHQPEDIEHHQSHGELLANHGILSDPALVSLTREALARHLDGMPRIRLGTQGWLYDAWVGPFYPPHTRPADYLATYSRAFDTVEVDSTFYAIPAASTVRGWAQRTGSDFTFALKLPQEITHECRLRDAGEQLAQFLDVSRELGPKLGPILIQLGPDFGPVELPALAAFLPLLPRELDFAVEFRQRGWLSEGVLALLAEHRVALALTDARWIPRHVMLKLAERPTSDFAYVRWMGPDRELVDYSRIQVDRSREIAAWAAVLPALVAKVRVVYGYANNHFAGHSPATVQMLQEAMGLPVMNPATLGEQLTLF
jgi:uncharacterized protein YecE (DUF72 family)